MNKSFQKQKSSSKNNSKDEENDINEELISKKLSIKKSKLTSLFEKVYNHLLQNIKILIIPYLS